MWCLWTAARSARCACLPWSVLWSRSRLAWSTPWRSVCPHARTHTRTHTHAHTPACKDHTGLLEVTQWISGGGEDDAGTARHAGDAREKPLQPSADLSLDPVVHASGAWRGVEEEEEETLWIEACDL